MKPNYGFAKRQRELAKKQKKEEKRLKKLADDAPPTPDGAATGEAERPTASDEQQGS